MKHSRENLILGIETSCDETGAAIVAEGRHILANVVTSSLKEHSRYGGIIPEIASRRQMECIMPVVDSALQKSGTRLDDLTAIAVTKSPGLIGSLLVGVAFARALSYAIHKPLVEVNHIEAHLYANFLVSDTPKDHPVPRLPAVGLVVSGGHTSLYYIKNFNHIRLIGQKRDDAAGEAYDKVARLMDLGYPGGPVIDRIAQNYTKPVRLRFKCADLPDSHDFSFSGIKTAVLYHLQRRSSVSQEDKAEIAVAFQESVVENLVQKALKACQRKHCRTLLVGGGVAANSALRRRLAEKGKQHQVQIHIPPLALCLDNAAMIAGLGWPVWKNQKNILKNAAFDYNKN